MFVKQRDEKCKKQIRSFFDHECREPNVLKGYHGFVTKQLYHMLYMDLFTVDYELLIRQGVVRIVEPRYVLFDYKKRNPLNHAAFVTEISVDSIG